MHDGTPGMRLDAAPAVLYGATNSIAFLLVAWAELSGRSPFDLDMAHKIISIAIMLGFCATSLFSFIIAELMMKYGFPIWSPSIPNWFFNLAIIFSAFIALSVALLGGLLFLSYVYFYLSTFLIALRTGMNILHVHDSTKEWRS